MRRLSAIGGEARSYCRADPTPRRTNGCTELDEDAATAAPTCAAAMCVFPPAHASALERTFRWDPSFPEAIESAQTVVEFLLQRLAAPVPPLV